MEDLQSINDANMAVIDINAAMRTLGENDPEVSIELLYDAKQRVERIIRRMEKNAQI